MQGVNRPVEARRGDRGDSPRDVTGRCLREELGTRAARPSRAARNEARWGGFVAGDSSGLAKRILSSSLVRRGGLTALRCLPGGGPMKKPHPHHLVIAL